VCGRADGTFWIGETGTGAGVAGAGLATPPASGATVIGGVVTGGFAGGVETCDRAEPVCACTPNSAASPPIKASPPPSNQRLVREMRRIPASRPETFPVATSPPNLASVWSGGT
jgi:hypothetical protein